MNNPFKPKEVNLKNYNAVNYENKKLDNILNSKIKIHEQINNQSINKEPNNNPTPNISNEQKIEEMKNRIDNLNKMRNYGNKSN